MTARRRWYKSTNATVSRWIVDVDYLHPDGTRERIRRTSPIQTRRGAEQYDRDIRAELAARTGLSKENQAVGPKPTLRAERSGFEDALFSDFAMEFLKKYAQANNKPSEVDGKKRILERHLVPFFQGAMLSAISNREIESYKALKTEQKLSAKTINNHLVVLGKMLRVAESWQVLEKAPKILILRVPQHEREFLSFQEAQALIDAADPGLWRDMITVAVRTGLRLGELRALARRDIDIDRHQLTVRRAAWKQIVTSPKSGRHRVVDLSAQAEKALARALESTGDLLFSGPGDTMLNKEACKWPLWRACDRAGLPKRIGWHALRHTFASHLVARGAPLKAVQELLGHTDIKMTMRYAHLAPRDRRRAVCLLDDS